MLRAAALLTLLPLLPFASAPPTGRGGQETPPDLQLSPGPAAVAWAAVTANTPPATLSAPAWPAWTARGEDGWGAPAPWKRWVEIVRAEAEGEVDPTRRAALAFFARARGRDFEAWDHFAACAAAPQVLATLAPAFFPGSPLGHAAQAGGSPAPLPEGVLLTPALPPRPFVENGQPVGLTEHALEHGGFLIGETTVSMRLELERDGVQVDLFHIQGPPVTVRVLLPVPPQEEIGVSYVDWFRQDVPHGPLEVTVSEEEPKHELWGRFRTRSAPWPSRLPRALPSQVGLAGIVLRVPAELVESPFLGQFAAALGRLLDARCRLVAATAPPDDSGFEPLTIHLAPGPEFERKLAGILTLAEEFVLAR